MPSLSERVNALPQFQGRAWNEIDPKEIQQATERLMAEDQAAYDRSKRRWRIADRVATAAAGTALGYGALSALGGAGAAAAPTSTAATTASGGVASVPGAVSGTLGIPTVVGSSALPSTSLMAGGFAPFASMTAPNSGGSRMSDLLRYGVPAVSSLITNGMANRASGNASDAALAEQRRQFELTQAWLREQDQRRHDEWEKTEATKKAQWDAEQAEKRRRYDALQPWRDASQGALTRLSDLMQRGPQNVTYQPTFRYQP